LGSHYNFYPIISIKEKPIMQTSRLLLTILLISALPVMAAEKVVPIKAISPAGVGKIIGIVKLVDSDSGLVISPDLGELTPGLHGFHIHENSSCDASEKDGKKVAGQAAGGHYDPVYSMKHEGPVGKGHFGDLPALKVGADGTANTPVVAPRLKLADVIDHTIMIHEGGDNYSDMPKPLGGGGVRVACGIIE
jgi:Cu-Zn family superoxide dismutase